MKPYKGKIVGIIMSNKIAYFVFYFQNSIYCSFYYLISENTRKGKFLIELCHHKLYNSYEFHHFTDLTVEDIKSVFNDLFKKYSNLKDFLA